MQRLPQGPDHSQMPVERRDSASMAGTYSVHLTKHLHCFFELPGQGSALLLKQNFSLLSTWLKGNMEVAEGGTRRLPAALGTEQMQWLLDSHLCTGSTCCHWCQPFGQPVQDGAKTTGSKRTWYGQAHLPSAPEGMRNPAPGKPSYPSIPGNNNSNPRGSKPHAASVTTHKHTQSKQQQEHPVPQITQRMGGFQGRGPGEVLSCSATTT